MRFLLYFGLALIAGVSPALASGGMSCTASNGSVSFSISGVITTGMGSPLLQMKGEVATGFKGISADLTKLTYGDDNVAQWWLDEETMNLRLYFERGPALPHGYSELIIKTKRVGDGAYEGQYEISSYEMQGDEMDEPKTGSSQGGVVCMAD